MEEKSHSLNSKSRRSFLETGIKMAGSLVIASGVSGIAQGTVEAQPSYSESQRNALALQIQQESGIIVAQRAEHNEAQVMYLRGVLQAVRKYKRIGITNFNHRFNGPLRLTVNAMGSTIDGTRFFGEKTNSYYVNLRGVPQIVLNCSQGIPTIQQIEELVTHEFAHALGDKDNDPIEDHIGYSKILLTRQSKSLEPYGYSHEATMNDILTKPPWEIVQRYNGLDVLPFNPSSSRDLQFAYIRESRNPVIEGYAVALAAYVSDPEGLKNSPYPRHAEWAEQEVQRLKTS